MEEVKRKRVLRSEEEKRALLEAFLRSGLARSEFCKRAGVAENSLYGWARQRKASAFIELAREKPSWAAELELGMGVTLRLRG